MTSFHETQEWIANLKEIIKDGELPESCHNTLVKLLEFFDRPIHTWNLFERQDCPPESTSNSLTEQVVLETTRHFVWSQLYQKLKNLQFEKGEVFQIEHTPLDFPDFENSEKSSDDYPPRTLIFEACSVALNTDRNPIDPVKFLRIYTINLPHTEAMVYGDGEDFSQYFSYIQSHIHSAQTVVGEEEMFLLIQKEWERNKREAYPTIAGGRAYKEGVVLYFYYTQSYIFSAELRIDEFKAGAPYPQLRYNPWVFPFPVYYTHAVNFRKFRYLRDLE